jgi:hypothetical protein
MTPNRKIHPEGAGRRRKRAGRGRLIEIQLRRSTGRVPDARVRHPFDSI